MTDKPDNMGYWNGKGRHQAIYESIQHLVPISGGTGKVEGECLRAAGKLYYEFRNNGGGNNVSGAFMYLKEKFPGFKEEWTEKLLPFVTGEGPMPHSLEPLYDVTEEIMDAVAPWVGERMDSLTPTNEEMLDYRVERTGAEGIFDDDHEDEDDLEDEFDEDEEAAYSR